MKVKKLQLKNFKRFTDLTIEGIKETTKLVLLIGANGSGKSSVFDAFGLFSKPNKGGNMNYFSKGKLEKFEIELSTHEKGNIIATNFLNSEVNDVLCQTKDNGEVGHFIGRSSLRILPKLLNATLDEKIIEKDLDAPLFYTDYDLKFTNDVLKFTNDINNSLRNILFSGSKSIDTSEILSRFIEPINESLKRIFNLEKPLLIQLTQLEDQEPGKPANLIFQKGVSTISYDLLSHGEKQVVILLLNFIVRKEQYENALIFIDEMDVHMNTALQYALLKEITENWIPESSQLWTASHALGFIEYAKNNEASEIIDLDQLNFDLPQVISPLEEENLDVYDIAIPKEILTKLFKGKNIIMCKNTDAEFYNLALGKENDVFIGVRDSKEVFLNCLSNENYLGLRDRDFLKNSEILKLKEKHSNLKVLKYYSFENYLYHPENIEELSIKDFDKEQYIEDIIEQKNERLIEIVSHIVDARQSYEEFKKGYYSEEKKNVTEITKALESNDFETFYQYYNFRDKYNRTFLSNLNLLKKDLVQTKWFKQKIKSIIND